MKIGSSEAGETKEKEKDRLEDGAFKNGRMREIENRGGAFNSLNFSTSKTGF